MLIEMYPQRMGPLFMDFLSMLMNHSQKLYDQYIGDWHAQHEGYENVLDMLGDVLKRMNMHPEYFAGLLLHSRLKPQAIKFLLNPNQHIDYWRAGSDLTDYSSIIPDTLLEEMVRRHEKDPKQRALIIAIAQEKPELVENFILNNWRDIPQQTLAVLLRDSEISLDNLSAMEDVMSREHFLSKASFIYGSASRHEYQRT